MGAFQLAEYGGAEYDNVSANVDSLVVLRFPAPLGLDCMLYAPAYASGVCVLHPTTSGIGVNSLYITGTVCSGIVNGLTVCSRVAMSAELNLASVRILEGDPEAETEVGEEAGELEARLGGRDRDKRLFKDLGRSSAMINRGVYGGG
jgi:hypothetical protein